MSSSSKLAILKKLQCERAQGYYLARPMPASDVDSLIAQGQTWEID